MPAGDKALKLPGEKSSGQAEGTDDGDGPPPAARPQMTPRVGGCGQHGHCRDVRHSQILGEQDQQAYQCQSRWSASRGGNRAATERDPSCAVR